MPVFRFLAFLFFSLGLLVQGAAQAAAVPQPQSAAMDCAEMSRSMDAGMPMGMDAVDADGPAKTNIPCDGMDLGCLIAMGCIGAPVLADSQASDTVIAVKAEQPPSGSFARLYGRLIRPEFPPPQAHLTA